MKVETFVLLVNLEDLCIFQLLLIQYDVQYDVLTQYDVGLSYGDFIVLR